MQKEEIDGHWQLKSINSETLGVAGKRDFDFGKKKKQQLRDYINKRFDNEENIKSHFNYVLRDYKV
jgi:hypothetical protein